MRLYCEMRHRRQENGLELLPTEAEETDKAISRMMDHKTIFTSQLREGKR